MTNTVKAWIAAGAALLVTVVILLVVLIAQGAAAEHARQEAECDARYSDVYSIVFCKEMLK